MLAHRLANATSHTRTLCLLRPFLRIRCYTDYTSATQLNHRERDILHTRCTVLKMGKDSTVKMANKENLSKMKLCRENGIQPRDLRILDTDIEDTPPSILVRTGTILFCLPALRAIIKSDKVLFLEPLPEEESPPTGEHKARVVEGEELQLSGNDKPPPPSEPVRSIAEDIRRLSVRDRAAVHHVAQAQEGEEAAEREYGAPFEFLALEALLSHALQEQAAISKDVSTRVSTLLHAMSTAEVISTSHLQELVEVKDAAEVFLRQAKELREALNSILGEPQDMKTMYLTEAEAGNPRETGDDDELELLLEAYVNHVSSLGSTAAQNISRLNAAGSHINLLLSSTRNRLLHLEIRVAIVTLAFGSGALVASLFGMNLTSGLEEHPQAFYVVTACIAVMSLTYWRIGRAALSRTRRLKVSQAGMLAGREGAKRIGAGAGMEVAKDMGKVGVRTT